MIAIKNIIISLFLLLGIFFPNDNINIVHIPISGDIDMGLPYYIERGINSAHEESAQLIIFEIDTFGGRVDAATKIKDLILESDIETIAFINRRAI